jgi:hypothetical protein
MNELINKLFEQALEEFKAENKYATIIVPNPLKEKFAELIVKECKKAIDPTGDLTSMSEAGWREACMKMIDEHFGVEL